MSSKGNKGTAPLLVRSGISGLQMKCATDEKMLFQELIAIIRRCVCACTCMCVCVCYSKYPVLTGH